MGLEVGQKKESISESCLFGYLFDKFDLFGIFLSADPDPLRLYITGFTRSTTQSELQKLFPKAKDFSMPIRKKDKSPLG